ncbi:nucleolar protein dao-5-like [Triplophysa dalaica]|uniref:nucleolar protein dao-5-like n=1 Tax=Triplophysa dalaica TaxID=1582913 RepID=UPI0024DFAAD9|nr:nucleolar protein dao-5-like [Triplophysa dalaica]
MRKIKKRYSIREQEGVISESLEDSTSETKTESIRGRKKDREGRREMRKRERKTDDAEGIRRESTLKPLVKNSVSVPVRSKKTKKRAKDSEQHVNVSELKREMKKMQTDTKTSPAVHRKSRKESRDASPLSIDTLTLSLPSTPIQVAPCPPASAAERLKSCHPSRLEPLVIHVHPRPSTATPERSEVRRSRRERRKEPENMDHEAPKPLVIRVDPQPATASPERSEEKRSVNKPKKGDKKTDNEVPEPLVRRFDPKPSTSSPERAKMRRSRRKLRKEAENMDPEGFHRPALPDQNPEQTEVTKYEAGPPTPAPTAEMVKSHHSSVPEPLVTSQSDLFTGLVLVDIEDEDEVHIISPFVLNDTRQRRPKSMRKKQPMFSWMEENKEMLESERSAKKLNNAKDTDHSGSSPYIPYKYTEAISLSAPSSQSDLIVMDINDNSESDEPGMKFISPFKLKDTRHRRPKPMIKDQPMFCWMENTEMLESESEMDEVQPEAPEQQETPVRKSHPESNTDKQQTLQKEEDAHENIIMTAPNGPAGDTQDHLKGSEKTKAASKTKGLFVLHHWLEKKTKERQEEKMRKGWEIVETQSLRERYLNSPALKHLCVNKNNSYYIPNLLL